MRAYPPLTHALLRQLIEYDPNTGVWGCKAKLGFDRETGTLVLKTMVEYDPDAEILTPKSQPLTGWIHENPYEHDGKIITYRNRIIQVNGKPYRASRLAWFYMTGTLPSEDQEIDHINNDALDDRWQNLRLATRSQQAQNARRRNKTGYKGVNYHLASGKHRAYITVKGKQISLGYYDTAEEAYAAYCIAAKEQWGEFANVESMPKDDES